MNNEFNTLPWHDALIQSLFIDRHKPGENDIVRIAVDWPDGTPPSVLEFYSCYRLNMNMNFGMITSESILTAKCYSFGEEIETLKLTWLKMTVDLKEINCYKIVTNSTNSTIEIYSFGYRIFVS